MSRTELYPWTMLREVGDYFLLPKTVQPFEYMKRFVAVRNSRLKGVSKHVVADLGDHTIVILAQVNSEVPPYEYEDSSGALCSGSRNVLIEKLRGNVQEVGVKPVVAPRTVSQKVAAMSPEQRMANLPWWYDPRTGHFLVNPKIIDDEDSDLWHKGLLKPGSETPYPEKYHLDDDLQRKSRAQIMEEAEDEDEWAGMPANVESGDDDE